MNNNKHDESALLAGCKGVFQKTSYITFGNKECVLVPTSLPFVSKCKPEK